MPLCTCTDVGIHGHALWIQDDEADDKKCCNSAMSLHWLDLPVYPLYSVIDKHIMYKFCLCVGAVARAHVLHVHIYLYGRGEGRGRGGGMGGKRGGGEAGMGVEQVCCRLGIMHTCLFLCDGLGSGWEQVE